MSEQESQLKRLVELQEKLLAQARQTNQLLLMLVDALGDEDTGEEAPITHYMDGTPIGYQPSVGPLGASPGDE